MTDRPMIVHPQTLKRVANDKCPKCHGGELDTGWECNFCGYDAGWLSSYLPKKETKP